MPALNSRRAASDGEASRDVRLPDQAASDAQDDQAFFRDSGVKIVPEVDARDARARVYDLLPRIMAARARHLGGSEVGLETSLSALAATLLELNEEMSGLSSLISSDDARLTAIAAVVNRIVTSVEAMLDAMDAT